MRLHEIDDRDTPVGSAHESIDAQFLGEDFYYSYAAATDSGYARLPAYGQIDLRCDRRFVFKTFTLELYAELQNATLSRQVVGVEYLGSQLYNETSYRIVLPSIGVHGEM